MNKESLDLNNLKKHSRLAEPRWSFLIIILAMVFALTVFIATTYVTILYFTTLEIAYLAVFATLIIGDFAAILQLAALGRNIKKNNEEARKETLKFYNQYKLFFEEYRFDVMLINNIRQISTLYSGDLSMQSFMKSYGLVLSKFIAEQDFDKIKVRKRLFKIFNTLDEIISILSEGTLDFDYLIDKFKDDITKFLSNIKTIYELMKSENEELNYPANHSLVYLDKAYLLCYSNNKGGESHVQEEN